MRNHSICAAALAALLAALVPAAASAAGGSSAPSAQQDPRAAAKESYNRALKYRDKAWELEKELAAANEAKAAKLDKKIAKEYQKAIRALRSAVEGDPSLYQAWSSLGYALRKTGEYEESLAAYDRSLELAPRYAEAIEYRGEAYLALGRLDDVKTAYMELFRIDPPRAAELMDAMQAWVEERGSGSQEAEEFAAWVAERAEIAARTAAVSSDAGSW